MSEIGFSSTCWVIYSNPPQLRYSQLRYFRSYAILNWAKKNLSSAILLFSPSYDIFFPPSYFIFFFSPNYTTPYVLEEKKV